MARWINQLVQNSNLKPIDQAEILAEVVADRIPEDWLPSFITVVRELQQGGQDVK
jgi:hypothetical protein